MVVSPAVADTWEVIQFGVTTSTVSASRRSSKLQPPPLLQAWSLAQSPLDRLEPTPNVSIITGMQFVLKFQVTKEFVPVVGIMATFSK